MSKISALIAIDARSIKNNKMCGISRSIISLLKNLSLIDTKNKYIVYFNNAVPEINLGSNFILKKTYCSKTNPFHDLKFYCILKKDQIGIYHSPHSWLPLALPKGVKKIVTIHDLFAIVDSSFFIKYWPFQRFIRNYFLSLIKSTIAKADSVITVSRYCKNELIKLFPSCINKIEVIFNAPGICNNEQFRKIPSTKHIINGKYLLYLGNSRSYKNLETLIDGFAIFLKNNANHEDLELKLVITGNDDYSNIITRANRLNLQKNIIVLNDPSDEEVVSLYAHAIAFIFPSKYEGFGLPLLEAMSFGVPVVSSDAKVFSEIANGASLVFNKDSPEELASKIKLILTDDNLRKTLISNGYEQIKNYTWRESALKLKEVYENYL